MKKLAFVLGYAGGILALIFSLVMIYTVPVGLLAKVTDDIKYEMKNENIIALNEVGYYAQEHPITDFSQRGLVEYAGAAAENNEIFSDADIYEDSVVFAHKTAVHGIISIVLIGVSILFALFGFIGALVCRKAHTGGAVMMLIASLVLLLCAIYTNTVLPMIVASVLLAGAGILKFVPVSESAGARYRAKRVKPKQYPQPYIQQPFQPLPQHQQFAQPQYAQPQYPQPQSPQQAAAQATEAPAAVRPDVPFPDEDVQVFAQPADLEGIKE
jgi:hypothetical protein